jgi:hypothetical protein
MVSTNVTRRSAIAIPPGCGHSAINGHHAGCDLHRTQSWLTMSRGSPPGDCGRESCAPWLGAVLSHGECGDEIHLHRHVCRGTAVRPACPSSRQLSSRGSCGRLAPSLLRGIGPHSSAGDHSVSGGLRNAATSTTYPSEDTRRIVVIREIEAPRADESWRSVATRAVPRFC